MVVKGVLMSHTSPAFKSAYLQGEKSRAPVNADTSLSFSHVSRPHSVAALFPFQFIHPLSSSISVTSITWAEAADPCSSQGHHSKLLAAMF